jgi:hypothetical protein
MEVNLTVFQLALLSWAVCILGILIGWFLAALCTCGKIQDLERQLRAYQDADR